MAKQYTPDEVKDLCIKVRVRQQGDDLFVSHDDPMDFVSMASLNPAAINDFDPFSTQLEPPEDLDSFLNQQLEGQRRATNEIYLKLLKLPGMLEAVDTLMNEELLNFDQKITPKKIDAILISKKAKKIVELRKKRDLALADTKYFKCYVALFTNGRPESGKRILLYFKYTDAFGHFATRLQETTSNCIIPPPGVAAPQQQPRHGPNSQEPIFRKRDNNDRGYSLLDGPWLYRMSHSGDGKFEPWTPISCERQYLAMVDTLKKENDRNQGVEGKSQLYVLVQHSMEVGLDDKYKEDQRKQRQMAVDWEKDYKKACEDGCIAGVNPDDKDDWGSSFAQYLREQTEKHFRSP